MTSKWHFSFIVYSYVCPRAVGTRLRGFRAAGAAITIGDRASDADLIPDVNVTRRTRRSHPRSPLKHRPFHVYHGPCYETCTNRWRRLLAAILTIALSLNNCFRLIIRTLRRPRLPSIFANIPLQSERLPGLLFLRTNLTPAI